MVLYYTSLFSKPSLGLCMYVTMCVYFLEQSSKVIFQVFLIGNGWASVLKTNLSNGITESSPKSKYKYFNVSPRKNVSILSLLWGGTSVTSSNDVYPPDFTFVYFSNASKICQPWSRYLQFLEICQLQEWYSLQELTDNERKSYEKFSYFVSFVIR